MSENIEKALKLAEEIEEYYFKNPDEATLPSPHHESHFTHADDNGLIVENHSAFWLPEFEITEKIKNVTYVVDGTYDGDELLHEKLERILTHDINENTEDN